MSNSFAPRTQQRDGFALPALPNTSSSSLMDAVVGGPQQASRGSNLGRVSENPLADASSRVNETEKAEMQELERNLQKRRSLIPHLESELAALEAQIKAAEERLSRVEGAKAQASTW